MNIIFTRPGKYKNGTGVTEVSVKDVESEKVIAVNDTHGLMFLGTGAAIPEPVKEPKKEDFTPDDGGLIDLSTLKVKELVELANEKDIDLEGATKKDEIIEKINKSLEVEK